MGIEDRSALGAPVHGHGRRRPKEGAAASPRSSKRIKTRGCDRRSRSWVFSSRDLPRKNRFVIVSYNILGVENASKHPDLYKFVDPKHLQWDRRKRRIRKELRQYDPGILCFQEVDRFDDLANLLYRDDYAGVYQGRSGDANDGCAIFWRKEQFALLHEENIQFQDFGLRNNVAQICVFKVLGSRRDQRLLVGNIHVLFNPNRGDVKLDAIATGEGTRDIREMGCRRRGDRRRLQQPSAGTILIQSALYRFVADARLDYLKHDRRAISGQIKGSFGRRSFDWKRGWSEEERLLAAGSGERDLLVHPLRLRSAYAGVPGSSRDRHGEPLVTSFHSRFMGTVDYIWHSGGLAAAGVVETPRVGAVRELGCLPSKRWGSDHLALVCEFAFVADDGAGAAKVSD